MTVKQRVAAKDIVENGSSVRAAMKRAGYSENTMVDPGKLTRSIGFVEVMKEMGIDDASLAKVLKEGLKATTKGEPDYSVRHKYLETGLRVKGYTSKDDAGDTYNTFIQQNNINPNTPDAKDLVDSTLDMLMKQTKRDVKTD